MLSKNLVVMIVFSLVLFSFFVAPASMTGRPIHSISIDCPECVEIAEKIDQLTRELGVVAEERKQIIDKIDSLNPQLEELLGDLDRKVSENNNLWNEIEDLKRRTDEVRQDAESCRETCVGDECAACEIIYKAAVELNERMIAGLEKHDFNEQVISIMEETRNLLINKIDELHNELEFVEGVGNRILDELSSLDYEYDLCLEACKQNQLEREIERQPISYGEVIGVSQNTQQQEEIPIVRGECLTFGQCMTVCAAVDCKDNDGCFECDMSIPQLVPVLR